MLTMNKTVFVVTKAVTAGSTLFLLIVGSTCVYPALRAIYGTPANQEISLLLAWFTIPAGLGYKASTIAKLVSSFSTAVVALVCAIRISICN
jgi:hypothetical protein